MGLFGGGNSSSSTTSQSAGFSQVGNATQLLGNNNKITLSDSGAIQAAQNIAGEALSQVQLAGQNQSNTLSQAISAIAQANQGQSQSIIMTGIKWGALILLGYFVMRAFSKGGG